MRKKISLSLSSLPDVLLLEAVQGCNSSSLSKGHVKYIKAPESGTMEKGWQMLQLFLSNFPDSWIQKKELICASDPKENVLPLELGKDQRILYVQYC